MHRMCSIRGPQPFPQCAKAPIDTVLHSAQVGMCYNTGTTGPLPPSCPFCRMWVFCINASRRAWDVAIWKHADIIFDALCLKLQGWVLGTFSLVLHWLQMYSCDNETVPSVSLQWVLLYQRMVLMLWFIAMARFPRINFLGVVSVTEVPGIRMWSESVFNLCRFLPPPPLSLSSLG